MSSKLFPRLLGVLGICAIMSGLYWAIIKYGIATQEGLATNLVERLDGDPARVDAYLSEMSREILMAGIGGLLAAAVLAGIWLILINRNPPYGDKSARSKRGSWAGLMILSIVIAISLFWFKVIGAPIAEMLAPSVPLNASALGVGFVAFAYWLSTALFAPASTKVAVPGGSLFGG